MEASGHESDLDRAMRALADGDRSQAEGVFNALWPIVLRFCERALGSYGGSSTEAQDAAQEALIKLFAQVPSYDSRKPAVAWALAIANFECLTLRKRRARRNEGEVPIDLVDPSADAEALAMKEEVSAALEHALSALSKDDQVTLKKAFFEEISGDATFRKQKQRALERLRITFRRWYGD